MTTMPVPMTSVMPLPDVITWHTIAAIMMLAPMIYAFRLVDASASRSIAMMATNAPMTCAMLLPDVIPVHTIAAMMTPARMTPAIRT